MDKFSKSNKTKKSKEILYSDDYASIVKYEDWSILTGKDCVFCIPFFTQLNKFIIRKEYIPSYKMSSGQEMHLSCVGGEIESGETPEIAILRELQEEAGIVLRDNLKIEFMKPLFIFKGSSIKINLAILMLSETDYHEVMIQGDGSENEKLSETAKIDLKYIKSLNSTDLITEYLLMQLRLFLNIP